MNYVKEGVNMKGKLINHVRESYGPTNVKYQVDVAALRMRVHSVRCVVTQRRL